MEDVGVRRLLRPELIILTCALLVAMGLMWRSSTEECHHWRDRLGRVTGAFLAAAGEKEYPEPGSRTADQDRREAMRRASSEVLDERPFGCL